MAEQLCTLFPTFKQADAIADKVDDIHMVKSWKRGQGTLEPTLYKLNL